MQGKMKIKGSMAAASKFTPEKNMSTYETVN
jgi:hypothetical protein